MNLQINNQLFIVGGATSGFGGAIAEKLALEGAQVLAIARRGAMLTTLKKKYKGQIETIKGDLTKPKTLDKILKKVGDRHLAGVLMNAGGPPANSAMETTLEQWDEAYHSVLRWKIDLTKRLMPIFIKQEYGRLVFIESISVKQPVPNLVLSNSLRMAVVGFVKTMSQEVISKGITMNILGPGYHDTAAVDRIFQKKAEQLGQPFEQVKKEFIASLKTGNMGSPADLGELALWLLSPNSRYITGQTIIVGGGVFAGI